VELRHLITFKSIVELGSFGKAAERLGYAPSTITAHVRALEEELGYPVFERFGKRMNLTEMGKVFYPYAVKMIDLYAEAKNAQQPSADVQGELKIGAPESVTTYLLPQLLRKFKELNPKVHLSLKVANCSTLLDFLKTGDVDICFIMDCHPKHFTHFQLEKLRDEPMVIIYPLQATGTFQKGKEAINLPFKQQSVIFTEKDCSYRPLFEQYLDKSGLEIESTFEFWSIEAIKQFVISGLGISFLPRMAVEREIAEGKLDALSWRQQDGNVSVYYAYHKDKWITPAMARFLQIIEEEQKVKA
jgi:DNA-binding transcriptional LysR family regulator